MDSSLVAILGRGRGYVHVCLLSKFAKQVFCLRWPCPFYIEPIFTLFVIISSCLILLFQRHVSLVEILP